jgi:hypothetical protein
MPTGTLIAPFNTISTTQGAVIVPVADSPGKYYIFSLAGTLSYCKINMTLDGGLGDVMPGVRGIVIDNLFSEKMTVVQGNNCNIWLLLHKKDNLNFYAYNISSAGIGPPVVSATGIYPGWYNNIYGVMVCSPNRHTLLTCSTGYPAGVELYDFAPSTGIVSNRRVLDTVNSYYGAEFSPDNTYDIALPSLAAIVASRVTVAVGSIGGISQLKLGPDNKIYLNRFSDLSSAFLDVFNYPNLPGGFCGYSPHAVSLSAGTYGFLGLPNIFVTPGMGTATSFNSQDTFLCIHTGDTIQIAAHDSAAVYEWYDGGYNSTHAVTSYGDFYVQEGTGCSSIMDTIKVRPIYDSVFTHSDTAVCIQSEQDSCSLIAPPGSYYLWYDGTTDSFNTVHHDGIYVVAYTIECSRIFDTIHVVFKYHPLPIAGPDSVCTNNSIILTDVSTSGIWSSGSTITAIIDPNSGLLTGMGSGMVTITYAKFPGCQETKNVTVLPPPCVSAVNETAINKDDIRIFPNPANDACTISCKGMYQKADIFISDISGKLIHTYTLTGAATLISTADLPPGIYQCKVIQAGKEGICKKLVIMR